MEQPQTIIEALEFSAAQPGGRGIAVYDRRGQKAEFHSHAEMLARAALSAAKLAAAGIAPGDRVLMCAPTHWDLIDAFFGCLLRGALPTLVAPPGGLGGASAHAKKIEALVELLGSRRIFCDDATRAELLEFSSQAIAKLTLTAAELFALTPAAGIKTHRANPGDLAFLQLTSGSTGRQRAVMIRHSNVISNTRAISRFLGAKPHSSDNSAVSWLPLNHDMGLVGNLLFSISDGLNMHLFRPETFLARPAAWLRALASHPGSFASAPNFAYQLCVERVDLAELAGCDLSDCRGMLTGAEMIRPETCVAFEKKFAPLGFKPHLFLPCYGMAEATLAVTADLRREGPRTISASGVDESLRAGLGSNALVCTGAPVLDTSVSIRAPGSDQNLSDGKVGEVCVSGAGVFAGYYNDPEATAAALQNGWLRTGDLGFLKDGELYLTGRCKDLLIIHGHNIMPHEIEWLAESASGAGGSERSGAFSISRGAEGEQAVVVLELAAVDASTLTALEHDIRSRVGRALGLPLADVLFIKRGQMPKTTSGKVQRAELRRRYLEGQLERLV